MVDKVTQANKKIAAAAAKAARGPVGAGIFELPTFAKSMTPQMLFDLAKDRGAITKEEQADFTKRVGKDPTALAEYNKKVPLSLKYQGIQPELKGVFASQGATPMTADNKKLRADTSKLAKKTFDQVNAMDAPKETKIQKFMEIFVSKAKNVSPEAALNLARRFVMGLFFGGPSTLGADLIPQSVMESMAQDLGAMKKEPMTFRDGGMMNINEMIRPIGMEHGGNPMDALLSKRASIIGTINAERGVPGVLGGGIDEEKIKVLQIELDQIDKMISMLNRSEE